MSEKLRHRFFTSIFAILAVLGMNLLLRITALPDISALGQIAAGETHVEIRDLTGKNLFVYQSPAYGVKSYVSLDEISDEVIAATIATEDRSFFSNPGFSVYAILRAAIQNMILRRTYSGASTITQQVVKNILLPPEIRYERSLSRKAEEIFLAAAVTIKYDKELILNLYLNEIYYGNNAVGVEMAAENYFGKHAAELDLAEAAFIAGLPQAPNYYGVDPNAGTRRQRTVLQTIERVIQETGCIRLESGRDARMYCPEPEVLDQAMGR